MDGQWRPVLDFYEGLVSASLDARLDDEEAEAHRAYAAATHNLLDQLHIIGDDAMSWMLPREALLRPVDEHLRPSKRPRHSDDPRPLAAAIPSAHIENEEAEGGKEKHWAEGIVGLYEVVEGDRNGRPYFRCRKW